MRKRKVESFDCNKMRFIAEQIGIVENEFKKEIVKILSNVNKPSRAYLVRVEYKNSHDFNVALCIALKNGYDQELVNPIALVFRKMFGIYEHLDILFIDEHQETDLRKTCCPFFSSEYFYKPDFYLSSSEGYNLEALRACFKERRFIGSHPDGYMLCEIDPPILGQSYGLGAKDINQIVIASRHAGYSIFDIKEWPAYVHVARLSRDIARDQFVLEEEDIKSIGWAEISEKH
jgi:hypothetical protein